MHFDLAHAALIVIALLATNAVLAKSGILGQEDKHQWNWKRFLAYFLVTFLVNLAWPV